MSLSPGDHTAIRHKPPHSSDPLHLSSPPPHSPSPYSPPTSLPSQVRHELVHVLRTPHEARAAGVDAPPRPHVQEVHPTVRSLTPRVPEHVRHRRRLVHELQAPLRVHVVVRGAAEDAAVHERPVHLLAPRPSIAVVF